MNATTPRWKWSLILGVTGAGVGMLLAWIGNYVDRNNGRATDDVEMGLMMSLGLFAGALLGAAIGAIVATWKMRGSQH